MMVVIYYNDGGNITNCIACFARSNVILNEHPEEIYGGYFRRRDHQHGECVGEFSKVCPSMNLG